MLNVINIRNQINAKNGSCNTYYATVKNNDLVVNEYDHFPFTRFWKGVPLSQYPYIDSREAGWRIRDDKCYEGCSIAQNVLKPDNCFEAACSTVFPCRPKSGTLSDPFKDVMINKNCVTEYR
jgi:hypothetical protein